MPVQNSEGSADPATDVVHRSETPNHSLIVPGLAAVVMLLGAFGSWPYGYFTLLRWVTAASAALFAFAGYKAKNPWVLWTFSFLAVLFNPLAPVYLTREIWLPIDVLAAIAFGIAFAHQASQRAE